MTLIRIGQIAYTNILPVYHFVQRDRFFGQAEWIEQVPSQLNQKMAAGEMDLGPISSFAYAQYHDRLTLLSDLSISAKGLVRSIFLFSKKPIKELSDLTIALTSASATSVNLLKIILEKFYSVQPRYVTMAPDIGVMMDQADAALLIGDDAMRADRMNLPYYQYDLGELWYKETGMWMIFAVWAVRNEVIRQWPEQLKQIHEAFLSSKSLGRERLEEVIRVVQSSFGGEHGYWKTYYSGLSYDFSEDHKRGLEYYYQCAVELGLLEQPVQVKTWNGTGTIKIENS